VKLLSDLPRTAKYTALAQIPWGVFGRVVLFYAPLYMKEMGLDEIQIGSISTVGLFFAMIFQIIASPISNKLGRKRTIFIFDLICWSTPMFIWAFAQNYWYFVVAAVVNAAVKVSGVAYFCLLTEDTKPVKRVKVIGIVNVINNAAGVLMPLAGFAIAYYGIIPTFRTLYFVGGIVMTLGFIIRNKLITETTAGKTLMKSHSKMHFSSSLLSGFKIFSKSVKLKEFRKILYIYIITNVIFAANFIQIIYLKNHLGFDEKSLSITQVIASLIYLLYLVILPRIKGGQDNKILTYSLFTGVLGAVLLVIAPKQNLMFMLITIAIVTLGNFISVTYRDAVFMNSVGELEKADLFSTVQIVAAIICTPVGWLVGHGYTYDSKLPFLCISILFLLAALISATILDKASLKKTTSQ
jgi:MFS family permease